MLVLELQKKLCGHPRICNINFAELPKLERDTVIYIYIYIYIYIEVMGKLTLKSIGHHTTGSLNLVGV